MNERNEAERERERGEGGVRRHNHLAGSKSITGETMKLSRRYLPTTSHADRECRPLLSGSRCSSRVPVSRRSLSSRGGSYYPTTSLVARKWPIFEERGCLDRFRGRDIGSRWNFSRGSTFVRENCDEMQRHLANWLLFDNVGILYTRPRDSKLVSLLSNIQRVSNSHSRPMNRERDSFPASTRGKKRREERNGSSWRSANRFVCAANESRLRIDHESFARGK